MRNIKLIIFDLDGTLINAYAAIEKSFNYVMRTLELKIQNSGVIRRAVGWGDGNLLKPFVPSENLDQALSLYRKHHKHSLLKYAHLYPYAKSLLRQLKARGYKLAVASNRPTEFSLILLRHLQIFDYFDYVLCADKLKHGKPNPEILNKIVKRFAFKKSQVLYVGDMVIDAQAANRAKINAIIVMGGSSSKSEIKKEKPFKIIPAIGKLMQMLE
ncbi:MAG: HAD family hydrolase [Candidatus Omnitrophota bacterium]